MRKLFFALVCLLVFIATTVSAQSRRQPFKFEVTAVDAKTHQRRSTFLLGESVAVRISLTNHSRRAQTISVLEDTPIEYKLHSTDPYDYAPTILDGYFGGTSYARDIGGHVTWLVRQPRTITIAPGQTVSRTIELDYFFEHPPEEGTYTLTTKYNSSLGATISFRVIVDEAKSVPLLEKLAATPVRNGNDSLQRWASASLELVRQPSISGRIIDSDGQPLNEIRIDITGAMESNTETRKSGHYRVDLLKPGSTYTITPALSHNSHSGEIQYTLEPASKTITVLNSKITDVNFIARRVRTEKNFALDDEGSTTKASSIRDWMFEPEHVIDRYRMVSVGETAPEYWNDGTPNAFPDWIEVDFNVTRRINWINVFTLPDNLNDPPDPDLNEKFSLHGITDFDVQYWTGRAWRTVPGGAIRGNRNVWRMIRFPETVTRKIRVVVLNALGGESRITEIEAIRFNDLPTAKIAVEGKGNNATATAYTNSPVQFRTEAFDRDGTIRHYELEFGDDTGDYKWSFYREQGVERPPLQLTHSHVYESAGTYTVTLSVADDNDEVTKTTFLLTVIDPPTTRADRTGSIRPKLKKATSRR